MKKNATLFFSALIIITVSVFFSKMLYADDGALQKRLAYLNDIPEVSWVEFNKNNVYVGFNTVPQDISNIINAAAMHGNRTINFGVHVWAVPDKYRNFTPGSDPFYCEATARKGKFESTCHVR